ncbi:MAG TPA: hypothetical protein VF188_05270 [Longimicrobiales bacterium]
MNEDRFDDVLREAARDYNAPPEPPREAMWARIQAARHGDGARRPGSRNPWWHWGLGLAAMLALGFGVGRLTVGLAPDRDAVANSNPSADRPTTTQTTGGPDAPDTRNAATRLPYRLATVRHLSEAEALLTSFRVDPHARGADGELALWARDLLATTRLLLDSPAAEDPATRALLEDLELVLAQMAQLPAARATGDTGLIEQAIEQRGVLSRLRATVPVGPVPAET